MDMINNEGKIPELLKMKIKPEAEEVYLKQA